MNARPSLPPLRADLLLLHPPAVFDFRRRRDISFPFLGTSGDVPITPLYEYFPLGFKTLQRYLSEQGHEVRLLNLSTLLLRYPELDWTAVIDALDVRLLGIDLHWMVHVQGSLEVAEQIKRRRPELPIIFGGISSTYYANELVRMPGIDMVMRGYDTHEPMSRLLTALRRGGDLSAVPNLLWRAADGTVRDNGMTYLPATMGCGADWSMQPASGAGERPSIREFMSTQNAGCAYNCGWCGGSREAFRRVFTKKPSMARKPRHEVAYEFETMRRIPDVQNYHFYAVGSYNETRDGMAHFLDRVAASGFKSISYEQYRLTPEPILRRMAEANPRTTITLSPESHDPRVAKLSGRGVYTNEEMEAWIGKALDAGIHAIDIWYFIGMPEQDERSVMETVEYCEGLLDRFRGARVNPMLCPMVPFLDPASTFFERPEEHGYRVFYRTAAEHRRGMERASLINRINYETRWLSRSDLVHVGFGAIRRLMQAKADVRQLPASWVQRYVDKIDDSLAFLDVVHEADSLADPVQRARALDRLGDEIQRRNDELLFSGVSNQAYPINRQIGGRWFDEMGWPLEVLDAVTAAPGGAAAARPRPPAAHGQAPVSVTRGTLPSPV